MVPKDVHILIPKICEYVQLRHKGKLKLQIESRLLTADYKIGKLLWVIYYNHRNS